MTDARRDHRPRYALHAAAEFFGRVVEETFVPVGEPIEIGHTDVMAVPVPEGAPWLARATWKGPALVEVEDGSGEILHVTSDHPARITAGPVELTLALVPRFRMRRTGVFPWVASLAWLVVVVMSTLVVMQSDLLVAQRCELVPLAMRVLPEKQVVDSSVFAACFQRQAGVGVSHRYTAEYLARLLEKDYAGEDKGLIADRIDRKPSDNVTQDIYLPAGAKGPTDKMGGAADTSPEPVRTPPESETPAPPRPKEPPPPATDDEAPVIPREDEVSDEGVADAVLEPEDQPSTEEAEEPPPTEKEEGWGVPDWFDTQDAMVEEIQVELMLQYARQRLRIDPDDPHALSILSYYQYLANDLEGAEKTYDKYIALLPDEPAGYNNKALVYKRRGWYQKEEALYRQAIALDPQDETAMNNLAVNLAHQGRFDEAMALMEEVERLDPGNPYADLHRAKIHAAMGDEATALTFLEKALKGMARLDTLHHIEFRQDIRVDPAFEKLRRTERFRAILWKYYGKHSPLQE